MLLRAVLVGLFTLLAASQVIRTAAVAAYADERPARVAALWPGHPDVLTSVAMGEVGAAARRGQEPPAATIERLRELATADPLAPEPLLVQAAIAQRRGNSQRAEALLVMARARDPRSEAARFLLADLYLRSGRIDAGLAEMSVLGRLIPGAMAQVAPALATYATSDGAVPHVKRILRLYPELEPALLNALAEEPENADLILAIARPAAPADPALPWQAKLLSGLVEQGDYERAYRVWARLAGVPPATARGLFDPAFGATKAPPPFNWSLVSGASGVAEPDNGGLRVLYYGRDDTVLASQLMLLQPGRYRLEMKLSGEAGADSEIGWRVTCLPGNRPVLELPLGGRTGQVAGDLTIPAGCEAQRLDLRGEGQEFPRSANFQIDGLRLTRTGR